ncbi:Similar to Cisd3: CDGSH iron-sulfur domain-containing protein 3 [Cotesia congregata]|uniref:Mitochondrial (Mus musculus) n=1 Tax=Cotesia congregata TaxID=51543 RepID=A0A8J2MH01_COTCN|nr:Similar to Cisd3: CDGSH iron-sulfur domain-containing protein 3 [Cotesia congregata]
MSIINLINKVSSLRVNPSWCLTRLTRYATKQDSKDPEPEIPRNELQGLFSAQNQKENGKPYDKKPFKMRLEAGKRYAWCLCGHSKSQPICDGTHKNIFLKIKLRPILFEVKESKEYWLCNCKQTSNRPFCDGSHFDDDIQSKRF